MAAMANVLVGIHCVVPGCRSTLKKVNKWKSRPCVKPKHMGKTHAQCICPEPYEFFKFPAEIKLQKLWQERVNRPDLEINNLTRVCSLHFVDGRPTRRHYFPDLNLKERNIQSKRKEKADSKEDMPADEVDELALVQDQEDGDGDMDETSPASEKAGTVSIVPMEYLQDDDDDRGIDDDCHEGRLTISKYEYDCDREKSPSKNSITITRVSPSKSKGSENCTSNATSRSPQRPTNGLHRSKVDEEPDCPFEIEMIGDDEMEDDEEEDDESSDLSDGIELIHCTRSIDPPSKSHLQMSNNPSAKTLVIVGGGNSLLPPGQNRTNSTTVQLCNNKPKMVPILAVTSKSQLLGTTSGAATSNTFQPIITKLDTTSVVNKSFPTAGLPPGSKLVRLSNGTDMPRPSSPAVVATNGDGVNGSATAKPVATYDSSKQQLQIANPVKYIQDCHNRIAELLTEKQKLEVKNKQLETKNRHLETKNRVLEAKQKHWESMNKTQRPSLDTKPGLQLATPTFNLIPSLTQVMTVNGNTVSTVNSKGSTNAPASVGKPRISYVIRRQP